MAKIKSNFRSRFRQSFRQANLQPGKQDYTGNQFLSIERKFRGNRRKVLAYLGLGSNHGDRVGFIQQAVQLLKDIRQIEVLECSSLYETEPLGDEYTRDQWFVNAVAIIETSFSAEELLDVLSDIEARLTEMHKSELPGNTRDRPGRMRIIDLDILLYGDEVLETSQINIPHPRLHLRAFALVPLLELKPELMHPVLRKPVAQIHEELPAPEQVFLYGTRRSNENQD